MSSPHHPRIIFKSLRFSLLTLFVAGIAGVSTLCMPASAQDQATSASHSKGDSRSAETAQGQNTSTAQEEDETAVYKQSSSVRAVGTLLHLSPGVASTLFEYLNFAILGGVILFFLIKSLPKMFSDRQKKIDGQLVEARSATDEAQKRLQTVEERLGRLDREIEELRKRSEQEGVADEQRIKQSIEDERKRIVAATEQEISSLTSAAERSLRTFAAELAMERAMGHLQLTEQQDQALISDFAAGLEKTELHERRN